MSRFVFCLLLRRVLEEVAEDRDVAEQRHLRHVVDLALLDQAADHDALLVVHDDLGLQLALRPGRTELGILAAEVLGLLLDLEADRVVARDVRRDVERRGSASRAGCSDRSSRAGPTCPPRRRRQAEAAERQAGLVRDVVTDRELGLLVVDRDDVRRRQDVRVVLGRERLEQHRVRRDARAEERLRVRRAASRSGRRSRPVSRASDVGVERAQRRRLHAAEHEVAVVDRQAAVRARADRSSSFDRSGPRGSAPR